MNIKASNTTDFPVNNAFHTFDPRKILTDLPSGHGEKNINLIYEFYGSNNQAVKIIKLVQIINLFLLYVQKTVPDKSPIAENVAAAENK